MKLTFTPEKDLVLVRAVNGFEDKFFSEFPGLSSCGEPFVKFCSAKPFVVQSIVDRLKKKGISVTTPDKDLYSLLKQKGDLAPLPSGFEWHTKPLPFQEIATRYLYTHGGGGLLLDPGLGKTKVVLDFIKAKNLRRCLIICPNALRFVWEDEVRTHRPELTVSVAESTHFGQVNLSANLVVMNYEKAVCMGKDLLALAKKKGFDAVVIDEGLIKNPYSRRSELAHALGQYVEHRIVMSGTLVNNSPLDVYSVVKFLEPTLVGGSYTRFKRRYCKLRKISRKNSGGADFEMVLGYKDVDEVRSILESCSIVMTKDEWLAHLPKKVFEDIWVDLDPYQTQAMHGLQTNKFFATGQGDVVIDMPLTLAVKMYQISNGFLYLTPEGDQNYFDDLFASEDVKVKVSKKKSKMAKRETFYFGVPPKIRALIEYLRQHEGEKCIVWFNSCAEADLIEKALREWDISCISIRGGEPSIGDKVKAFNTDSTRVLLAQAKVINYGVTVMGKNLDKLSEDELEDQFPALNPVVATEIFYSLSFSLEVYLQQQDRIHRIGQVRTCKYVRLMSKCDIDQTIYDALEKKMSVRKVMLVDLAHRLSKGDSGQPLSVARTSSPTSSVRSDSEQTEDDLDYRNLPQIEGLE